MTAGCIPSTYPYHFMHGTVMLWSRFPLRDAARLDIKPRTLGSGWERALRAVAQTPAGDVAVYVVHLPSMRVKKTKGLDSTWRDDSAARLGAALRAEPLPRVVLIGDLNGTVQDRALRPITSQLSWAPTGFAWSFPAAFPLARVDQIMARPADLTGVWTLPRTGSDHLPIAARIRW
jgi:vancomycin resistance protein VanJ